MPKRFYCLTAFAFSSGWASNNSSCTCSERQYLCSALSPLQKVCPMLHHLRAWFQVECMVIGGTDSVARRVGEMQLDVVMVVALLVEDPLSHFQTINGGEGGIRTPDSLATMSDFESALDHTNPQCSCTFREYDFSRCHFWCYFWIPLFNNRSGGRA